MFTGLITHIGKVYSKTGKALCISEPNIIPDIDYGDSVCINGVCLTVAKKDSSSFTVDMLDETIKRSNLGKLKRGDIVNLELALKVGDRLGGHIVTGHVDTTGKLIKRIKKIKDTIMEIEIPAKMLSKISPKGSIAINGVSLTIADVGRRSFTAHLIPVSLNKTNLGKVKIGSLLNIEFDKYFNK